MFYQVRMGVEGVLDCVLDWFLIPDIQDTSRAATSTATTRNRVVNRS